MAEELIAGFDEEAFCGMVNEKFSGSFSRSEKRLPLKAEFPWEEARQLGIIKTLAGPNGSNMPLLVVTASLHDGEVLTERSSRIRQFKFAKQVLDDAISNPAPGVEGLLSQGLFVFYDELGNFRLSLVHGKAEGSKLVWSTAKRLSFYVEARQPNKTFRDRLALDWSSFDKLKEAFSVEKLTREFYTRLFTWYQRAMESDDVVFPNDIVKDKEPGEVKSEQMIRLITRLMFVWFLKQKHLVSNNLFDEAELEGILKNFDPKRGENYYRAILQNLFFATLNTEIGDRAFAVEGSRAENEEHFGVKIFYRYASEFAVSEKEVIELFGSIPFMNGGLFECLDRDNHYYDGFSRRKSKRAQVPNALFFDDKGLIPLLSQYNFTVEENSPGDEEVALDPEMLGKVFENLLAAYNPETNTQARKATGSFYTPREIVNYMVDESLIAYLKSKLTTEDTEKTEKDIGREKAQKAQKEHGGSPATANEGRDGSPSRPDGAPGGHALPDSAIEKKLRLLFAGTEGNPFSKEETEVLDKALTSAKILDPACGSGAFPMGILLRMVELLRILRNIPEDASVYDLKLELIENCIYGGDIQCIAVQISKLRFFISLVCEQKPTKNAEDNYGINTLPNLETKFVAANSLIGLPEAGKDVLELCTGDIADLKEELFEIRHRHFSARSYPEKQQLRREDKKLRNKIKRAVKQDAKPDRKHLDLLLKEREKVAEPKWVAQGPKTTTGEMFDEFPSEDGTPQGMFDENEKRRKQLDAEIAREQKKVNLPTTEVDQIADMLASWDPYNQNASADFSNPEWMFNVTDGFDVVIGNPPYTRKIPAFMKEIINTYYATANYQVDLYVAFFEKGFSLLRDNGTLSFITPNSWLKNLSMEKLRKYLLDNTKLISLTPNIAGVFTANVDTSIALFEKKTGPHSSQIIKIEDGVISVIHSVDCNEFRKNPGLIFDVESSPEIRALLHKIRDKGIPVGDIFEVTRGYNPYDAATGQSQSIIKRRAYHSDHKKDETFVPELKGKHVQPWSYCWDGKHYISYGDWLAAPRDPKFFTGPRLLFREILGQRLVCTYIEEDFKTDRSLYIAKPNDSSSLDTLSALGMLVSKLMSFYFRYANNEFDALFPKIRVAEFKQLPLAQVENIVTGKTFKQRVEQILTTKKSDPNADTSALEAEIDELVYELYGLTEEEKAIVEAAAMGDGEKKSKGRKSDAEKAAKKTVRRKKMNLPDSLPGWD